MIQNVAQLSYTGQYVYIDFLLMQILVVEGLTTELYRKLVSNKMGSFLIVKSFTSTENIYKAGITNNFQSNAQHWANAAYSPAHIRTCQQWHQKEITDWRNGRKRIHYTCQPVWRNIWHINTSCTSKEGMLHAVLKTRQTLVHHNREQFVARKHEMQKHSKWKNETCVKATRRDTTHKPAARQDTTIKLALRQHTSPKNRMRSM